MQSINACQLCSCEMATDTSIAALHSVGQTPPGSQSISTEAVLKDNTPHIAAMIKRFREAPPLPRDQRSAWDSHTISSVPDTQLPDEKYHDPPIQDTVYEGIDKDIIAESSTKVCKQHIQVGILFICLSAVTKQSCVQAQCPFCQCKYASV